MYQFLHDPPLHRTSLFATPKPCRLRPTFSPITGCPPMLSHHPLTPRTGDAVSPLHDRFSCAVRDEHLGGC